MPFHLLYEIVYVYKILQFQSGDGYYFFFNFNTANYFLLTITYVFVEFFVDKLIT
jgi:hypothetical protein